MSKGNVLITGTTYGIGRATAILFEKKGYTVYGIDCESSSLALDNYHHYQVDIRNLNDLPDLPELDYIINNAGVLEPEKDPIGVNILGTFNIEDKYIKPNVKKSLKAVVNVISITAYLGLDERYYTASKGGLMSYTKHLANVLGKYGIRVNSVSPGAGLTELTEKYIKSSDVYDKVAKSNLLNRWGEPEENAKAIYFLAVDATFTTGQDILVDGGEAIMNRYIPSEEEPIEYPD